MSLEYERKWEVRRQEGRSVSDQSRDSYYGVPVIHKPHWKWLIIFYFYFGGISGASYMIASVAQLFGGKKAHPIVRAGRYISLAALLPSPPLLILDLGRPERFHHMLRVFKLSSPMSVGTWGLSAFGGFCTLSALIQAAQDGRLGRKSLMARLLMALPSRAISVVGSFFGLFVAGYTGILVAATAVPLWSKPYRLMGPLFLSSALSNGIAAITLALSMQRGTGHEPLKRLERFEQIVLLSELGLTVAMRGVLGKKLARPLEEGPLALAHRGGVLGLGILLPLLLHLRSHLLGGHSSRQTSALSAMMVLIGGFLFRTVMVLAGRKSADDPQATFEMARADGRVSR